MVINEDYKFCFIQNPKCASTYVETCLKKLEGSHSGNLSKHIDLFTVGRRHKLKGYKVFGTVRHPLTHYQSIVSFSKDIKANHIYRMFGSEKRDEFVENLAYIRTHNEPRFKHFFRQEPNIELDYGWCTFAYKHYFSGEDIDIFTVEDDLPGKLNEYLEVDVFDDELVNTTEGKIELSEENKNLITERERFILEKFYEA